MDIPTSPLRTAPTRVALPLFLDALLACLLAQFLPRRFFGLSTALPALPPGQRHPLALMHGFSRPDFAPWHVCGAPPPPGRDAALPRRLRRGSPDITIAQAHSAPPRDRSRPAPFAVHRLLNTHHPPRLAVSRGASQFRAPTHAHFITIT